MCFCCASLTEPKQQGKLLLFYSKSSLSVFKIVVKKYVYMYFFVKMHIFCFGFTVLNKNDSLRVLEGHFLKINQTCYILNLKCFSMESLATSCGTIEK